MRAAPRPPIVQGTNPSHRRQLEVEPMASPTFEKVLLAFVPRAVMAVMHTTMIRASMTAYSTAVGPSSRLRKFATLEKNLRMERSFLKTRVPDTFPARFPWVGACAGVRQPAAPSGQFNRKVHSSGR